MDFPCERWAFNYGFVPAQVVKNADRQVVGVHDIEFTGRPWHWANADQPERSALKRPGEGIGAWIEEQAFGSQAPWQWGENIEERLQHWEGEKVRYGQLAEELKSHHSVPGVK